MAPHSSSLAWKIPWTEEPVRLQSMGSLRVGHDWATSLSLFTFLHWRRKWQPTPVFLPGESQGQGTWWADVYGVTQSRTWLKWLSISIAYYIMISMVSVVIIWNHAVIILLLTILHMLYITSLWLTYFTTESSCLLISITHFIHPITCLPSKKHFVTCACRSVPLLLYLFIFWFPL